MIPPVRCTTCGHPLGDLAIPFEEARAALTSQAIAGGEIAPYMFAVSGAQVVCGPVLDALGITGDCCRVHMISSVWFHLERER